MKTRILILAAMLAFLPLSLHAQWRVGVNAGATYNLYAIDKQYMTDYRYYGAGGVTMGVTGQYHFMDWLGVRMEIDLTQRNYQHTRAIYADRLDYHYHNDYLLVPAMVHFSFGGSLRGFANFGVYGGYWLKSHRDGKDYNSFSNRSFDIDEDIAFVPERDQRWDFGYVAGAGMEWQFARHWAVQLEARCNYSVISTVKQYMAHVKDYRYNTTFGLTAGFNYIF